MFSCDDESSRDSGICDMEEGVPTDFSGLPAADFVELDVEEHMEMFRSAVQEEEKMTGSHERISATFKEYHLFVLYRFPTIPMKTSTAYRRISVETLREVLESMEPSEFEQKYLLVDCRYPYEYEGGHIKNAINVWDRKEVHAFFFDNQKSESKAKIPIFYCEYSQKRGPAIANALRKADRERNVSIYPRCSYEEMYVLDKGYKRFYEYAIENTLNTLCEPSDYVPMDHPDHLDKLRKHQEHKKNKGNKTVINHMSQQMPACSSSSSSVKPYHSSPELADIRFSRKEESRVTLKDSTAKPGGLRVRSPNRQRHPLFESPPRRPDLPSPPTQEIPICKFELSP